MERIQSALAKARAARDRKMQVANPGAKTQTESGPWQDLAEIRLEGGVQDEV